MWGETSFIFFWLESLKGKTRHRHRQGDNIKADLREIGFGDIKWIHLAQDRDW
jgi:hypothetical protein